MQEPLSIRAAFKSKIPLLTARVRKRKRATPGSSPLVEIRFLGRDAVYHALIEIGGRQLPNSTGKGNVVTVMNFR